MIHALRHNLFGQRFEPREQQDGEGQHKHIHLHLHLHLSLGVRRVRRASQTTVARVTTIFAAFMGALFMALTLFIQTGVRNIPIEVPLFTIASHLILIGSLLGLGAVLAGGLPLVVATWRTAPRARLRLALPLFVPMMLLAFTPLFEPMLLLGMLLFVAVIWRPTWDRHFLFLIIPLLAVSVLFLPLLLQFIQSGFMPGMLRVKAVLLLGTLLLTATIWRPTWRKRFLFLIIPLLIVTLLFASWLLPFLPLLIVPLLNLLGPNGFLVFLLYGVPLISTIALVSAVRQAQISDKLLSFANRFSRLVVLGMLLMLVGTVLWGFALALFAPAWFFALISLLTYPWNSWLLIALGMLLAMIFALWASFSHAQAPASQPFPHDDSPHDVVASQQERNYEEGYRG